MHDTRSTQVRSLSLCVYDINASENPQLYPLLLCVLTIVASTHVGCRSLSPPGAKPGVSPLFRPFSKPEPFVFFKGDLSPLTEHHVPSLDLFYSICGHTCPRRRCGCVQWGCVRWPVWPDVFGQVPRLESKGQCGGI